MRLVEKKRPSPRNHYNVTIAAYTLEFVRTYVNILRKLDE